MSGRGLPRVAQRARCLVLERPCLTEAKQGRRLVPWGVMGRSHLPPWSSEPHISRSIRERPWRGPGQRRSNNLSGVQHCGPWLRIAPARLGRCRGGRVGASPTERPPHRWCGGRSCWLGHPPVPRAEHRKRYVRPLHGSVTLLAQLAMPPDLAASRGKSVVVHPRPPVAGPRRQHTSRHRSVPYRCWESWRDLGQWSRWPRWRYRGRREVGVDSGDHH